MERGRGEGGLETRPDGVPPIRRFRFPSSPMSASPAPADPIAAFLDETDPPVAAIVRAAQALVRGLFPEAHERFIAGWRAIGYSHGAGGAAPFALVSPVSGGVHVHLWNALRIDDRDGLLRGEGLWTRHVRLNAPADASNPGLARLIVVAAHIADPGTGARPPRRARDGRAVGEDGRSGG